ncbi:MAG: alpha-L-fucosidase [Acidobacteria bacterium]|nr:alpha-L-fucosidase [Acidobacteriota bacterium]
MRLLRPFRSLLIGLLAASLCPAQPDPAREKRLGWWREARFGMFIHWGLYAVPAGEWKGKPIAGIGEWIMNRAKIPVREYELLAGQFNPVKFNADEWVRLAKEAGQKYIVITSKHHDGFAMFGSQVSPYNIVSATPFKRDVMKELSAACQKQGIKLCFYYSQSQDWHHPDGLGNTWDYDDSKKNFPKYLNELVKPHVREILTNYGPIGLIWFDTPQRITRAQSQELADLVHSIQPDCLVSGRIGNEVGDYQSMGDNQIPARVMSYDWESPVTLNDTWGFKKDDHNWKSTRTLIHQLVDIASKNGNYLLNVGPTAEGVIPQPSADRLREVGQWIQVNGEAVYGAQPSPYPYEFEWGSITAKPGKLYLHLTEWPKRDFMLYGLKSKVTSARLLAQPGTPLKFAQIQDRTARLNVLRITLPSAAPDKDVSVVALELAGKPVVDTGLAQQPDGKVSLSPIFAEVGKASSNSAISIDNRGVATRWFNPEDKLSWKFRLYRGGTFRVVLVSSESRGAAGGDNWEGGHQVTVTAGGQSVTGAINDGDRRPNARNPRWRDVYSEIGRVSLRTQGMVDLTVKAESIAAAKKMGFTLREVQLVKAQDPPAPPAKKRRR